MSRPSLRILVRVVVRLDDVLKPEVLALVLRGEKVKCRGGFFDVNLGLAPLVIDETPLLLAALSPVMLRIAGEMAGGTVTWATDTRTLAEHIVPRITRAASDAGNSRPRVVAGLPVLLTQNVDKAKEMCAKVFAVYTQVPSYREMVDREGVTDLEDIAIIGNE